MDLSEVGRSLTHETTTSLSTTTSFVTPLSQLPLPPPKSPLRSSVTSPLTISPVGKPIPQASPTPSRPSQQRIHTHRYASSDPGHSSFSPTMSVVFPSQSSSPERSSTRMRTMPGYRTAHATHVRSFRERPMSLDAILESVASPHDGAPAGPSKPSYDHIYTGLRADDGEMLPFPRRTWAGESLDSRSTFALGSSTAELGSSTTILGNGEQRTRKTTNKLRKTPPRTRKASDRPVRRSPVRRSSSRRSPSGRVSPVRKSPSRRSPSPSKKKTRTISFTWRGFGSRKRKTSQGSETNDAAPQVMEGYLIEPFAGGQELRGERPLSYVSTTSVGAESFYTARGSMTSPVLPPGSRPMSMVSWDSNWDGRRMSMVSCEDGDGGASTLNAVATRC